MTSGLFDDLQDDPKPKRKTSGLFDDLKPDPRFADVLGGSGAAVGAGGKNRNGLVDDVALALRTGASRVTQGALSTPVVLGNLAVDPVPVRAARWIGGKLGFDMPETTTLGLVSGQNYFHQPDAVLGTVSEIDDAIQKDFAQNASDYTRQKSAEFEAVDGLKDSAAFMVRNPRFTLGTLGAEQIPQFAMPIMPGGSKTTLALQAISAGGQAASGVDSELRAKGYSEDQIARQASGAALGSAVVNTLPSAGLSKYGGMAFERMVGGELGQGVVRNSAERALLFAKALGGETASNVAEEASDQANQNFFADAPIGRGVGKAAAIGGLMGVGTGAPAGLVDAIGASAPAADGTEPFMGRVTIDPETGLPAVDLVPNDAPDVAVAPEPTADIDALLGQVPPEVLGEVAKAVAPVLDTKALADAGVVLGEPAPAQAEAALSEASSPEPAFNEVEAWLRGLQEVMAKPQAAPEPAPAMPAPAEPAAQKPAMQPVEVAPELTPEPPVTSGEQASAEPQQRPSRFSALDMKSLVGWSTMGGRMVRAAPDEFTFNDEERQGIVDTPRGEVIGRTSWVGMDGPDGQESTFWRNRPVKFTPAQANAAFDKYERGEKLSKPEQRFIDYAQQVAEQYDQAMQLLDDERAGHEQEARMWEREELSASAGVAIDEADGGEALSLYELYREIARAGGNLDEAQPAPNEGGGEYAARLWNKLNEARNGADQRAETGDRTQGVRGRSGRNPEPVQQEQAAGFRLDQEQDGTAPAAKEVIPNAEAFSLEGEQKSQAVEDDEARRAVSARQTGLFGASETRRAADEQSESRDRNAPDAGVGGGLFAGQRTSPEARQIQAAAERSQMQGEREADEMGLRDAVDDVLQNANVPVHYLSDDYGLEGLVHDGYTDRLRSQQQKRGGKGKTAGLYIPAHWSMDGKPFVVLFTGVVRDPLSAQFTVAHEVAGHHGLRTLLGNDLDNVLRLADQNPTVKAVADSMMRRRKMGADKRLLAVEEALSDINAALRTGDFNEFKRRHGIDIPEGIRARLARAIDNIVRKLRALFNKQGITFSDEQVRALLDAAWAAAQGDSATISQLRGDGSLEQVVFHGTPHTVDRFSLQKIGTGEGAQAYGWGLYFASLKKIAEEYRRRLAPPVYLYGGRPFDPTNPAHITAFLPRRELEMLVNTGETDSYDTSEITAANARKALAYLNDAGKPAEITKVDGGGNLYQVDVPEDSDLLDWDKKISEQPAGVREKLQPLMELVYGDEAPNKDPNAAHFYGRIGLALEPADGSGPLNQELASRALLDAGIPGLRYLDGGSRSNGEGSHNYVIWDEAAISEPESVLESVEDQTQARSHFAGMTREQFLGKPKITSNANAADLVPRARAELSDVEAVPFAAGEGLTAKYSPHSSAVFDGDKVVASYNDGSTLVVDKKYRRQGIAEELVYQWRSRNPSAKPATTRTKASQALQEKVWKRIERERATELNQSAPIDQTQTEAFKRWFGDSKVVDENGKPLVVYHGTNKVFDSFRAGRGELGIHFGTQQAANDLLSARKPNGPQNVMPVYLSIKNPLRLPDLDFWVASDVVAEIAKQIEGFSVEPRTGFLGSKDLHNADIVTELERRGFDGVIYENKLEDAGSTSYIAFRPNQIKSATANSGNFDPANPSILESVDDDGRPGIRQDSTASSIISEGRLLSLVDEAKAAGINLAPLTDAYAKRDHDAAMGAIEGILSKLRETRKPEPMRSTGTKNAVTDAERSAMNRSPILKEAAKSNEATLYEAMRTVKDDPLAGREAVARLARGGSEGISLADEAVLLVYKTELLNKRDAAEKRLSDEKASEDAKASARAAWEAAEAEITAIDIAAVNAGREWGRFGQFRQRMLRADFTFEALERKERARLERPLTAEESATVKAMADKIAVLQQRVDELQARVSNAESESAYDALTRSLARPPKQRRTLDHLRKAANDARARLAANQGVPSRNRQSGAVIGPGVFYDYAVIGAYHIANGAAKFSDWVSAMTADLGEKFTRLKAEHPNIFKAAQSELDKPINADATVDEVLAKIDLANIKPKDVRNLIAALVGEGVRGEPKVIAAAAEHLSLDEAEVRDLFVQTEPRARQTLTEAQEELRDLRAVIRLQKEIERLEAGQPKPARGQPAVDSPAVAAKKRELAEVRQRLKPQRDPEGRYQEMRGKQIEKRIEVLRERIANKDFASKPRVPRALNEANQKAMFELEKAKHDFLRHQFEDNLKRRTPLGKVLGTVGDTFNLARAVMTSFDLSAVLRQGGFISYGHPIMALKAFWPSLKAFVSDQSEHKVRAEIESRRNAPLYAKFGLQLTGIGAGPLTQIEEAYASRWLERLPAWLGFGLVRGSGRAYTAFLNKLRADSFDAMAASLSKRSALTEAEGKAIANYINVATGRGKIGRRENAAQVLNTVFFAPRLVASRFQLLAGLPMYGGTNRTRKLIAADYARFLMGVSVTMGLAAFALGDDDDDSDKPVVNFDPRSADFGKIRIGNTYLDPLAGLAQVTVLVTRLATGETVTGAGAVKPLRPEYTLTDLRRALGEEIPAHELDKDGKLPFGSGSSAGTIGRFLRTKLAPVPGAIINSLSGSNLIGETVTPATAAVEMVTPMALSDVSDIMAEHGVPKGTAITLVSLLGIGAQTRDPPSAMDLADAAKSDLRERLMKLPKEQWQSELDRQKSKYGTLLDGVTLQTYKKDGKNGKAGEPRRTEDGAPVFTTERISDRETMHANYRAKMEREGFSPDQISRLLGRSEINHIIPDNVVRQHPLMAAARGFGYDVDRADNLIAMPNNEADATEPGALIGHKGSHPRYDKTVSEALDEASKALRREYRSIERAPKPAVMEAVKKVEAEMRRRIKRNEVPVKGWKLAANDEGDAKVA